MVKRWGTLVTLMALLLAASASARTWRVEKDGSGDFTILYEAADACAAGDTILIGPGRFEEYRREPDYQWHAYCCIHIRVPNVTIIGSGTDFTAIGFEHFDPYHENFVIGISSYPNDLTVENLTVGGIYEGIHFEGPNLRVENCDIVETDVGVATWGPSSTTLHQCRIIASQSRGVLGAHANGVSITDCEFADGRAYAISGVGGAGWVVRNCDFNNYGGGVQFEQGATGIFENCRVQVSSGNAPGIGILDGCVFSLSNNEFSSGGWAGYFATGGTTVTARNNVFIGGSYTSIEINRTPMDFRQNHIINGGGPSVRALWARGSLSQPVEVDLSGNYWGTNEPAQIATWIDDYTDHSPMESAYFVVIHYEPFEDQPVQTEQTTWGAVKSLFRD